MEDFINLHVHTAVGSLLDSILTVEELADFAKDNGQSAIAVTDHGKMHAFVDVVKACKKRNVKPIIGCEVYEVDDQALKADTKTSKQERYHLVLLAKNHDGLLNLFKIVSDACIDGMYKKPRTSFDVIEKNGWGDGIICLTACQAGRLSKYMTSGRADEAYTLYKRLRNIFSDVFIEVQSHGTEDQIAANMAIRSFIDRYKVPYVITTDAHMLSEHDLESHSIFVQIGEGREPGESYKDCYLQTSADVYRIMGKNFDKDFIQKGIWQSVKIAEMIDDIDIGLNKGTIMPEITVEGKFTTHEEYLRDLVYRTFDAKFGHMSAEAQEKRRQRIEMELPVLYALKYTDYFIMLYMIAVEADRRGIPRGYSRGSGANCLCLFMLNVTQIDSVRWNLDFSRFANLGRRSVADFDWDISKRRRKEMVTISEELFGKSHVAPICTFNTLSTKVAIKDIGKVMNEDPAGPYFGKLPYDLCNEVTKLIPTVKTLDELGQEVEKDVLLKDILSKNAKLSGIYEEFPLWFKHVMRLEGLPKSMGRHAAGTLITPKPVIEYCPLCMDREGNWICQLEMHAAMDDLGLTKMDYLGLENLDTIDDTLKMAGLTWEDVDINHLNLDDKKVYDEVYKKGNTIGIFQMESAEAKRMCIEASVDNINDVIVVNAANRPGTKDSFPTYCENKLHPENVKLLHEDLKKLFGNTHYVLLYQEQALSMFRYAGFPETEVDNARRAIGKKKADVMASLEKQFKDGLALKGWDDKQCNEIWELILKQSSYCFNLGHAAAYGLLSYLTAYLKTYYPVEFMCACLIAKREDTGKMGIFINECERLGIKVLPPSVNRSMIDFTADKNKRRILFGLGAIKGMGDEVSKQVIANRPYTGFEDFLTRVNDGKPGVRNVVQLIKAGAIPSKNKAELILRYANMVFDSEYKEKDFKVLATLPKISILKDEWGIDTDTVKSKADRLALYNEKRKQKWDSEKLQRLTEKETKRNQFIRDFKEKYMQNPHMWEFEALSMFITENPIRDSYKYISRTFPEADNGEALTVICVIIDIQRRRDKRGGQFAYLHVYTPEGIIEAVCWANQYSEYSNLISKGSDIVIYGKKKDSSLIVSRMKPYKQWLKDRGIRRVT